MNSTGQDDGYISRLIQCAIDECEEINRTGTGRTNPSPLQDFCVQGSSTPFIQRSFGANDPFCLNTTLQVPLSSNDTHVYTNDSPQTCVQQQNFSQFNLKKPLVPLKTENTSTLKLKTFAHNGTGLQSHITGYLEDNTEDVIKRKDSENHYFSLFMAREYEKQAASPQVNKRVETEKVIGSKESKGRSSSRVKKFSFPANTSGAVNEEIIGTEMNSSKTKEICHANEVGDVEKVRIESDFQSSLANENSVSGTVSKDCQQRDSNTFLKEEDEIENISEVVRIIKELNEDLKQDKNCDNVLEPDLGLLCKFCGLVYCSDTALDIHMDSEHPEKEIDNSFHEHEREYMRLTEELVREQRARKVSEPNEVVSEEEGDDDIQYSESDTNKAQCKVDSTAFQANNDRTNTGSFPKRRGRRPKHLKNKGYDLSKRSRQSRKSPRVRKRSYELSGSDKGSSKKPRMVDTEMVHTRERHIEDANSSSDDDVILVEEPIELVVLDSDDSQDEEIKDVKDEAENHGLMKDAKQVNVTSDGGNPYRASPGKKNISEVSRQPNSVSDKFLLQKYGIKNATVYVEKSPLKTSQSQIYVRPSPSKKKQCGAKISGEVIGQGILTHADKLGTHDKHSLQNIPDCSLPKSDESLSLVSARSLSFTQADDQISEVSNRSISPQPSTSSGYIYVPRKRTARKSVKDEALKKQYSLKEVRVMLKNITSVERALLRNPHSSFGKSDWLHKLQSNADSESDDNLDWKAPIMSLLESDEDEMAVPKRSENSPIKGKGKAPSKGKKSQNNINTGKKGSSGTLSKVKEVDDVTDWTSGTTWESVKRLTRTRKDYAQGSMKRLVRESNQDESLMKQFGLKEPKILLQNVGKLEASMLKKSDSKYKTTKWLQAFPEHTTSDSDDENELKVPAIDMINSGAKTMSLRNHESKCEKSMGKLRVKTRRKLEKSESDKTNNNLSCCVRRENTKTCNSDASLLKKFGITRSLVVLQNQTTSESTKPGSKLKSNEESAKEVSTIQVEVQRSLRKCIKMNVSKKRQEIMQKMKTKRKLDKAIKYSTISRRKQSPTEKSNSSMLRVKVREKRIKGCSLEPVTKQKMRTRIEQDKEVCKPLSIPLIPVDDRKIAGEDDKATVLDSHKGNVSTYCEPKGQNEVLYKVSEESYGKFDVHTHSLSSMKEREDRCDETDIVMPARNMDGQMITLECTENDIENDLSNTDAEAAFSSCCDTEVASGSMKDHDGKLDKNDKDKNGKRKRVNGSKDCEQDGSEEEGQEQHSSKIKVAKLDSKQVPILKEMQLKLRKIALSQDVVKGTVKALASEDTPFCKDKGLNSEAKNKGCSGKELSKPNLEKVDDTEYTETDVDNSGEIAGKVRKTQSVEGESHTSTSKMDHSISSVKDIEEKTEEVEDVESHVKDTSGIVKPPGIDEVDGICSEQPQNINEKINESEEGNNDRSTEACEKITNVPKVGEDSDVSHQEDKDLNSKVSMKSCTDEELSEANLEKVDDTEHRVTDIVLEVAENENEPDLCGDDQKNIPTDTEKKCSDSVKRSHTYESNDFENTEDNLCCSSRPDSNYVEDLSVKDQLKQCEIENCNIEKVIERVVKMEVSEIDNTDIDKSENTDEKVRKTQNNVGESQTSISNLDHNISSVESSYEMGEDGGKNESHDRDSSVKAKTPRSDKLDGMICSEEVEKMNEYINESDRVNDDRSTEAMLVNTRVCERKTIAPKIQSDVGGDPDITHNTVVNTNTDFTVVTETFDAHANCNNDSISGSDRSVLTNSLSAELGCDAGNVKQGSELTNNFPVRSGGSLSIVDSISESVIGEVTIHGKP